MTNDSSFVAISAGKGLGGALKDTIEWQVWSLNGIAHAAQKVQTPSMFQQLFE